MERKGVVKWANAHRCSLWVIQIQAISISFLLLYTPCTIFGQFSKSICCQNKQQGASMETKSFIRERVCGLTGHNCANHSSSPMCDLVSVPVLEKQLTGFATYVYFYVILFCLKPKLICHSLRSPSVCVYNLCERAVCCEENEQKS